MRPRRWFWVLLFVLGVILLATLATGWNIVLVQLSHESVPWYGIVLGSLGFLATLTALILFFVRLLREMRLTQLQSEFLATVSHELKTPIATLELCAGLLQSSEAAPEERDRLWTMHGQELKRLRAEVETLLEAARWQSGKILPDREPVRVEDWIRSCQSRWRNILGPAGELHREGEPIELEADLDVRMLNLVTDNLIDNARKFARGTPRLVVRTRVVVADSKRARKRWEVRFEDSGWGFDPRDAGRIFRRFVRVKTDAPYAIPGTGLGLHLAATACRALGLRLEGESLGAGHGAAFILSGPLRDSDRHSDRDAEEAS